MKDIKRLISQMNITSRKREYLYPRFFLMNHIRNEFGISYQSIGNLFNKDHATVLNAIKGHKDMTDKRFPDAEYKLLTTHIRKLLLNDLNVLENDIVNCDTLEELELIQNKVRNDYYY